MRMSPILGGAALATWILIDSVDHSYLRFDKAVNVAVVACARGFRGKVAVSMSNITGIGGDALGLFKHQSRQCCHLHTMDWSTTATRVATLIDSTLKSGRSSCVEIQSRRACSQSAVAAAPTLRPLSTTTQDSELGEEPRANAGIWCYE